MENYFQRNILNDLLEKTYTNINCYEQYYGIEGKYKNLSF